MTEMQKLIKEYGGPTKMTAAMDRGLAAIGSKHKARLRTVEDQAAGSSPPDYEVDIRRNFLELYG